MSGLLFLQTCDFSTQPSTRGGEIVCHNIRGVSLILMYATKCEFCRRLIPIFKRLPGTIGGCQFGMVNIENERELVRMSVSSLVPISYVPLIVLYVNGKPFIRYDGAHEEQAIREFLIDVTNRLQTRERFAARSSTGGAASAADASSKCNGKTRDIPAFTIGYPLYGDEDDMYKEFDEAYPGR
jgi:thioredoxin-like negative regulator of GroEL